STSLRARLRGREEGSLQLSCSEHLSSQQRFGRCSQSAEFLASFVGFGSRGPSPRHRTETAYPAEGTLTCGRTSFDVLALVGCVSGQDLYGVADFHRRPMVRRESGVDGFHELLIC